MSGPRVAELTGRDGEGDNVALGVGYSVDFGSWATA